MTRYPTDTQSTYWLPTVTGSCDTIYNAEFAVPDNSDARLLYLESRTLPPLKNYDQTDMKRLWVISPDKDTRNTHLLDRFSTSLARTHFVFGCGHALRRQRRGRGGGTERSMHRVCRLQLAHASLVPAMPLGSLATGCSVQVARQGNAAARPARSDL